MSRFSDLLNSPLPSKTKSAEEMLAAIESELGIEEGNSFYEEGDVFGVGSDDMSGDPAEDEMEGCGSSEG